MTAFPSLSTRPPAATVARTIRTLLADDHVVVREGLRRLLDATPDIRVVAEVGDGEQALAVLQGQPIDVAVLDLSMPGPAGTDLIRRIKAEHPRVAVLVLTMHSEPAVALRAFRAGASGFLTKDGGADELTQAVRKVAGGGGYVTPALAEGLAVGLHTMNHEAPPHARLSAREHEVFRRIVAGERPSEIARALHLSVKTVSTHKARLLDKLGLDGTAALVRYGLEHRLFDDTGAEGPAASPPGD